MSDATNASEDRTRADRRAARKERTRRDTVDAAVELFTQKGYENTTVEDIAERARISPRTFFRYFATKEQVFFSNAEDYLDTIRQTLAEHPDGEPALEMVRAACVAVGRMWEEDRVFQLLSFEMVRGSTTLQAQALRLQLEWVALFAQAVAKRLAVHPRKDPRPILISQAAAGIVQAAMQIWGRSHGKPDLVGLINEGFNSLRDGIKY